MKKITFCFKLLMRYSILGCMLLQFSQTNAQVFKRIKGDVRPTVCPASGKTGNLYIPRPNSQYANGRIAEKKSQFILEFEGFENQREARDAFTFAVGIWEEILASDVPIRLKVRWRELEGSTLGSASPSTFYRNVDD